MTERYGENILFVHIPQKEEAISGHMNKFGKEADNKIKGAGGLLFDGHSQCGFSKIDYFVNDGHPNEGGYKKLSQCVRLAI